MEKTINKIAIYFLTKDPKNILKKIKETKSLENFGKQEAEEGKVMEKEYIAETESENIKDYGIYDEYYGISNIFNTLWKAREYIPQKMIQQDELKLKNWVLNKSEELKKDNIEISDEKVKLIFKREIREKEFGIFNRYFGNWNDIYKKVAVSYSKKSVVQFYEWKNKNEVIKRRTRGISINGSLDQKIERMMDKTAIEIRIGSDGYEIKTHFRKNMQLYFRNIKTNEWFYHKAGKIKKNTEATQICKDCIKILEMLKSRTVSEFEKKRLSKLIKDIKENFSDGRIIRYSLPKNSNETMKF